MNNVNLAFVVLEPQEEGGFVATSPLLPELVTGGETVHETVDNLRGALTSILKLYAVEKKAFPKFPDVNASFNQDIGNLGSELGELRTLVMMERDPEGQIVATSPMFPELVTGGETIHDTVNNLPDAISSVLMLYELKGIPSSNELGKVI